jgi:hypothetical protein
MNTEQYYTLHFDRVRRDNAICLSELINDGVFVQPRKRRMELAFRLSSAVLLLAPWIHDSWTWEDLWSTGEEEADNIFICHAFHPPQASVNGETALQAVWWSFLTRQQPLLTKLGLRLIELGLGRTFQIIREEEPNLLRGIDLTCLKLDSQNLFAAETLLRRGTILNETCREYDAAVRACLFHQYRGEGVGLGALDRNDESFNMGVQEAILMPLYRVYKSSW